MTPSHRALDRRLVVPGDDHDGEKWLHFLLRPRFRQAPVCDRRQARQARRPADNAARGFEDVRVALLKRAIRIGLAPLREAQAAAFLRRPAEVLHANRRLHPTTLRDRCRNRHEVMTLIRERLPRRIREQATDPQRRRRVVRHILDHPPTSEQVRPTIGRNALHERPQSDCVVHVDPLVCVQRDNERGCQPGRCRKEPVPVHRVVPAGIALTAGIGEKHAHEWMGAEDLAGRIRAAVVERDYRVRETAHGLEISRQVRGAIACRQQTNQGEGRLRRSGACAPTSSGRPRLSLSS